MYKLPIFGVDAINLAVTNFTSFLSDVAVNFQALDRAVGDVSLMYWNGVAGKAAGTVVAVCPTQLNSWPTVAEAYDTNVGGEAWRKRAVGVLLSNFPSVGDVVRVRHLGRVTVDKSQWTGLTRAGQVVYLKRGLSTDVDSQGLMTPVVGETLNGILLGNCSYGPHVIFRPKIVP